VVACIVRFTFVVPMRATQVTSSRTVAAFVSGASSVIV